MATPSELTSLDRERLRQEGARLLQAQKDTSLDLDKLIVSVFGYREKQGAIAERRAATAMKEVSDLEQLRAKLNADAFTKALGSVGSLVQQAMRGAITPRDQQDLIIKLKELQLASTRALTQVDNAALQRYTTLAQAVAGPQTDSATLTAEVYKQAVRDLKANGQYNPSLTGTVKAIEAMGPVPAELASDWSQIKSMSDERTNLINDINAFASQVPDNVGAMGPQAQAAEATKFIASMDPDAISVFATKLGRLPNAGSLDQPISDKKTEARVAKDKVDEFLNSDPMAIIAGLRAGAGEVKAKENERLRILSSDKFQRWAASNGLRVGSVRPATEADKGLPGYIASKNVVYVAGPEDDRALGIATKQATMKPSQMLIPRRGLETRKYVEATVGGAPQPGPTNFVKVATGADGQRVFFRPDGSAVKADGSSVEADVAAKLADIKDIPEDAKAKVNEMMADRVTTTGGGQKVRGVETALMWSDPPDAIMAVETPEGKRVIIRKQDEKNINVLSGGEERKGGVIRSLLAKARERIARPGEAELRAADEAAMVRADKAREAELEKQRQTELAAKPDRMKPAEAKAAVETATTEQPAFSYTETTEPRYTTPAMPTAQTSTATSPLDLGRARQVLGLLEKARETPSTDPRVASIIRRRQGLEFVARTQPEFYQQELVKLADEARKTISSMSGRDQPLSLGEELPDKEVDFLKSLANAPGSGDEAFNKRMPDRTGDTSFGIRMPDRTGDTAFAIRPASTKVTPTTAAGKEIREESPTNMTGANAPQMPGVATGTPSSAPAVPQTTGQRLAAALQNARSKRQQYDEEMSALNGGTTR